MLHIETGVSIPCDSSALHITKKGSEAQGFQGWSKPKAWTGGMETGSLMPQPDSQPPTDLQLGGKGCPSTKVLEHSLLSGKSPTGTANGTLERFVLSQSCVHSQGNMANFGDSSFPDSKLVILNPVAQACCRRTLRNP